MMERHALFGAHSLNKQVVIVGAGQAGLQVALSLRQGGHTGSIVMLGSEPHPPYQRPPQSKQLLTGEWPEEKCRLRHGDFFAEHAIDFRPATRVTGLDTGARQLLVEGAQTIGYEQLAICTGSRPNRLNLPGSALPGVHYLRTLDDAVALRHDLQPGQHLVIAGGGYIGLEVAASARKRGCGVNLIEPMGQLMQRSALAPIAAFLHDCHLEAGVRIHLGRSLGAIQGKGRVSSVRLDDGRNLPADVLLIGIGVHPELDWLTGSGIDTGRGVRVDGHCRTNIDHVWAAGDVCETHHPLLPQPMVLESVQNAVSQGKLVAANMLGQAQAYTETPWFWSEQYDCRLQMAGIARSGDELVIRESGPNSISVLSIGADGLNAIQCINAPRDYMAARKLIERREHSAALFQPATNLKDLL
jgi:3-phenylpropionate/trans-cinnamate dioxygenase ferredoxin reductase subunit